MCSPKFDRLCFEPYAEAGDELALHDEIFADICWIFLITSSASNAGVLGVAEVEQSLSHSRISMGLRTDLGRYYATAHVVTGCRAASMDARKSRRLRAPDSAA